MDVDAADVFEAVAEFFHHKHRDECSAERENIRPEGCRVIGEMEEAKNFLAPLGTTCRVTMRHIRNGIISVIDCRDSQQDGELAALRLLGEFVFQISPLRYLVEQVDFPDVAARDKIDFSRHAS